MKYLLLPLAIIIHVLMRWCEMGAKFFGRLNDKYLDYWTKEQSLQDNK